jgi:hypothetical protein
VAMPGFRSLSRRSAMRALGTTLAGLGIGGSVRPAAALTCAPRNAGCSVLQPCCADSRCRWLGGNPFVGICRGGRVTPPGIPARDGGTTLTCDDFTTQRAAWRFSRRLRNGNFARLDPDRDGTLCEQLPRR